ncbi:hypothetical protein Godav_025532 [Gossypium davidsonii]|uniref:Uncharacterized protein n=1 Tax=Gossypium davidsonii TaxID=34287 RepID=A0A7J8T9P7_GOSDV|nr:hypothetical protein [Gossypium davidsonii]
MLNNEILNLHPSKQPVFTQAPLISHVAENKISVNDVTLTDFDGR